MRSRTWRECAAPIIADVIKAEGATSPTLRRALREAYPFGERRYWPYKVWLNEITRQLEGRRVAWNRWEVDPRQQALFVIPDATIVTRPTPKEA